VCGLCLLLYGDCVCYCVAVVFVIVWGLCLLLWGGCVCYCGCCVCYCVGLCLLLWGLCLLLWGLCFLLSFSLLFKYNNVVWDKVSEVRGWRFIRCCLCQFEIGSLDKRLIDLLMSPFFVPHLGVSALCLKCTEHVDPNSCVVQ